MSFRDNSYQLSIHSRFDSCDPQLQCSHVYHLDIVCDKKQKRTLVKAAFKHFKNFVKIITEVNLPRARLTETALLLSERNRAASSKMILYTTYYTQQKQLVLYISYTYTSLNFVSAKPVARSYLSVEEEWSKETLLEMLKVSTTNSDLSGR